MKYLLSIVIPTRNRQEYALASIIQITGVMDARVQVVVTDNSDEPTLREMIVAHQWGARVKYSYVKERIPGVDNYARGIEQSDGEYVCCIGDDDGVLRQIVDIVAWASKNGIAAIKPGVQASYIWPGATAAFPTGCLNLEHVDATCFYVNPEKELDGFLKTGCIDFPSALLVKAYHGIVRKDIFERIKQKTGRYCGGLSPDIYLSVSLSLVTDRVLGLHVPLTIFGACRQSTTGDSLNKVNIGKLEDAPHFVGQPYTWSNRVPHFYCGMNIWADSAMHALTDMKAEDKLALYSIEELTCYCLLNYPQFQKEIRANFEENHCSEEELKKLLRQRKPAHLKNKLKAALRRNKVIAGVYRGLKARYQEKTNSGVFTRPGVADIVQAEEIVSNSVDKTITELLSNMNETTGGISGGK